MKRADVSAIGGEAPSNTASTTVEIGLPYRAIATIEGVCPFLFHRWNVEQIEIQSAGAKGSKVKKTDNVESYVWRDGKNDLCIPGEYLRQAVIGAAKYRQDPRSPKKSAMDLFKAGVVSLTELATLGRADWDYLDRRRVRIGLSCINRSRPAISTGWSGEFVFLVNLPEYIDGAMLNETLVNAGRLIGIGDFRPTYGRFVVTGFKVERD